MLIGINIYGSTRFGIFVGMTTDGYKVGVVDIVAS